VRAVLVLLLLALGLAAPLHARADGSVTMVLDADPADGTDFTFITTFPGQSFFFLDDAAVDDGDAFGSSATFPLAPGTYTIVASIPAGWSLASLGCTSSDPATAVTVVNNVAFFVLADGETVACTLVGRKRGTITVAEEALEKTGQDFTIQLGGDATSSAAIDDADPDDADGVARTSSWSLPPGSYTLSQVVPAGWNLTGLTCTTDDAAQPVTVAADLATIALDPGENVSCTFRNALERATITARLAMDPPSGANVTFLSTIPGATFFFLDDAAVDDGDGLGASVTFTPTPGSYTVLASIPADHALQGVDCTRSNPSDTLAVVNNVVLSAISGDHSLDCTFRIASTLPPTVAMSSAVPDPTNASPIPVTVQFSRGVTGFAAADVTVTHGTVANFVAVDADTYTFDLVPAAPGTVRAEIAAGAAQDAQGRDSLAAAPFERVYDNVAPDTTITLQPPAQTTLTSATFAFDGSGPGGAFECALDAAAFAPCASGAAYAGLGPGPHVFRVRAIDAAGNADPTPAVASWFVAAPAPPPTPVPGPGGLALAMLALGIVAIARREGNGRRACSRRTGSPPRGTDP
jgi:hypothetical protein